MSSFSDACDIPSNMASIIHGCSETYNEDTKDETSYCPGNDNVCNYNKRHLLVYSNMQALFFQFFDNRKMQI